MFKKKKTEIKKYNNFLEALSNCINAGYENSTLCEVVALKTLQYKSTLQTPPFLIKPVQSFLSLVVQHILLENNNQQISVVDFGGACGAHFFETKRFVSNNVFMKWSVVETGEMISHARKHHLESRELQFYNNLNDVSGDLAYFSSSIQYVPDPYSTIDLLLSKRFPYILFNRMMLNAASSEDLIIVQQSWLSANGPGIVDTGIQDRIIKYPHTTLSETKFMKKFEAEYELVFKFDESSGKIEQNNSNIVGGGFLFKRK